ncbi:MAG: fibronectin type III domain-containing protein [Vicinamibacterales bacterium]
MPVGVTRSVTLALPSAPLYLRMRSIAGGVASGPSNEVLANVNVPVAPSAPANLLGLAVGSTLRLAWTPTYSGGAPSAAVLEVTGAVNATLPLGAADAFSYAGVPAGSYTFRVRQANAAGLSPVSNAVSLTFPGTCSGAPGVPQNLVAAKSGTTLSLFWDPPATGAAPSAYVLTVTGAYSGSLPFTTRTLTTPVPAGTYNFTVAASNACGTGPGTPVQSVAIP